MQWLQPIRVAVPLLIELLDVASGDHGHPAENGSLDVRAAANPIASPSEVRGSGTLRSARASSEAEARSMRGAAATRARDAKRVLGI